MIIVGRDSSARPSGAGDGAVPAVGTGDSTPRGSNRMARRRRRQRGVTLVEFALLAPVLFLVLLGLIIVSIVAMNQVQLNNVVRDGARVAGLCGSGKHDASVVITGNPVGQQACTTANIQTYIRGHLQALPAGSVVLNVSITAPAGGNCGTCNDLSECSVGAILSISASYEQPLFVPLVSTLFSNNSPRDSNRLMTATAQSVCAQ